MSRYSFTFRKLFSLVGLVPIGAYVVVHLYKNMASLQGPDAYNRMLNEGRALPLIIPIMMILVWVPIFFHGLYGLYITVTESRPNPAGYPFFGNIKYLLQRASGIGILLFIPAHLWKSKIGPTFVDKNPADFAHMQDGLSEPVTLVVYILGVTGVAYHLANGIWQACIGWGLTLSERSMKRMEIFSMFLFAVLATMGFAAIWGLVR